MKNYTVETDPVFSESIRVTETSDPAHAENINAAPKQLLENTLYNKAVTEEIKQGEQEVAFEDYTGEEAAIPEAEEAINQLTSGKKETLPTICKSSFKRPSVACTEGFRYCSRQKPGTSICYCGSTGCLVGSASECSKAECRR